MSELIVNPEIPYVGTIPIGKLEPGRMCRIQGVTLPDIDRFNINLQTGPESKPRDDTGLHVSVRINQGYVARNSYTDGAWGDEEGAGNLTIGPAQSFEILILTDVRDYKIAVNGEHLCEFRHRIPFDKISHLLIDGDVKITLISWEQTVPLARNEPTLESSTANTNASQQFGPSGPGQYAPPNSYQPQGPYGGPPQYGPPQYGPPIPPGAQPQAESGFGGFFEQAQEALVGAIKSGAAEKILSGLLSSGGGDKQGYAPQNPQYGLYPQIPPDLNMSKNEPQNAHNRGPLETFLSGLLSNTSNNDPNAAYARPPQPDNMRYNDQNTQNYGQYPAAPPPPQQSRGPLESLLSGIIPSGSNEQGHPQHTNPPQIGGQGSVGGLGSMGGILSSLAGQILHNPKDDHRYQN